jgi:hypothetical protein
VRTGRGIACPGPSLLRLPGAHTLRGGPLLLWSAVSAECFRWWRVRDSSLPSAHFSIVTRTPLGKIAQNAASVATTRHQAPLHLTVHEAGLISCFLRANSREDRPRSSNFERIDRFLKALDMCRDHASRVCMFFRLAGDVHFKQAQILESRDVILPGTGTL